MVKVLFDHNMPPAVARALNELIKGDNHQALPLRDKFEISIPDVDYFNALGKEDDWVVISKDLKNGKSKAERSAITKNGILVFYLSPATQKQNIMQQAATIFWHWDKIVLQRKIATSGMFLLPVNKGSKFRSL
ncbi:PIN-like domain-containing protein [Aliiroseovarius sp. CAU 1755]